MFKCKKLFKLQIIPPSLILLIATLQDRWIFPSQSWEVRNSMMMMMMMMNIITIIIITILVPLNAPPSISSSLFSSQLSQLRTSHMPILSITRQSLVGRRFRKADNQDLYAWSGQIAESTRLQTNVKSEKFCSAAFW